MIENRLSVIFSTRKIDPQYVKHIERTCGLPLLDIIPIENDNKMSLTKAYNIGLDQAKYDLVVFMHDDLVFVTDNWGRKLCKHFTRNPEFGIIGVAGTNNLISGCWWQDRSSMHGIVNHTDGVKTWTSRFSEDQGDKLKEMTVLDGVFFAVDNRKIKNRFNEYFDGYHFYDLSFCLENHISGVKIGVFTDIRITHKSVGETNDKWEENKVKFEKKYSKFFNDYENL